jgi:hypothetical protein
MHADIKRIPGKLREVRQTDMLMYYSHVELNSISHFGRAQLCFETPTCTGKPNGRRTASFTRQIMATVSDICIMKHLNCSAMISWGNKNEFSSLNTFWLHVLQKQDSIMRNIKKFSCASLIWPVPCTELDFLQSLNNSDVLDRVQNFLRRSLWLVYSYNDSFSSRCQFI